MKYLVARKRACIVSLNRLCFASNVRLHKVMKKATLNKFPVIVAQ